MIFIMKLCISRFLEVMIPKIRYQRMSNKVINNQIRLSQFALVFTSYYVHTTFYEPRMRTLIRLLRLSRMTRRQEPSLAGSEWSIGQTRRTFRISVICGLNYSVNNTICSGLCSATGCASVEAGGITRQRGGGWQRDERGDWVRAGIGRAPAFVKPQHEPRL